MGPETHIPATDERQFFPHELLALFVRASFHDLSNKLSATRLWADMAARSGRPSDLDSVLSGLDDGQSVLMDVRCALNPSEERFQVGTELTRMHRLLTSDLLRRSMELDIACDGPYTIEGRRDLFVQVVSGALLASLDAAGDGTCWLLRLRCTGESAALELHGPSTPADSDGRRVLARAAFTPLLHAGRLCFERWPGDCAACDPDWILHLPRRSPRP